MSIYRGSMVAIVTPMTGDGAVDYGAMDRLIDFHLANQTDALVVVGTTGESATLDYDEHCQVIRHCVDKVAGKVPVIAGTGSNATHEAIELTECAKDAGADAALLVTPYYNKPTQEGMFRHFEAVAKAVDLPQILYNVPGRTAVDLLPETVGRLARIDNIIGIKDATGKLERVQQTRELTHAGFGLFTGDDATAVDFILLGGQGGISVTANLAPKAVHDAYMAALAGDAELARSLDAPLTDLHRDLFIEANPIPVKWALQRMGMIDRGIRLPLTELSSIHHPTLEAAMRKAGILA